MEAATANKKKHSINTFLTTVNYNNTDIKDYGVLLQKNGIEFKKDGSFLLVGSLCASSYWVIYVSVVRQQMPKLLEILLPELSEFDVSYRIPDNSNTHTIILDGGFGYDHTGKILTIFSHSNSDAAKIADLLIRKTEHLIGPDIPSATHLGNCAYADLKIVNRLTPDTGNSSSKRPKENSPFTQLKIKNGRPTGRWLMRTFFLVETLKSDIKGDVYKALNLSKWYDIKWCIVKQGNRNQCYDDAGRTIKNRLQWQFELQSIFSDLLRLPKAIAFFELNGNAFLIMDYIPGISLYEKLNILQKGTVWRALDKANQLKIVQYLIKTAELITKFHECGLVHRDLSPLNFIVEDTGEITPIDIELTYDFRADRPDPCYALGTAGYMSPAQTKMEVPVIGDDSFGFGGLLIRAFTGLSPTKFDLLHTNSIFEHLIWHIGSQRIVSLILSCFNNDAGSRPEFRAISHNLEVYQSIIITSSTSHANDLRENEELLNLKKVLDKCHVAFWQYPLMSKSQKWLFRTEQGDAVISNEFKSLCWYSGLSNGTSGVLYITGLADHMGFDLDQYRDLFYTNLDELLQFVVQHPDPGLLKGAYGFCFVFASLIKQGQVEKSILNLNLIADLLKRPTMQLNLSEGMAGQGLAMMLCAELLDFPTLTLECHAIAERLCSLQNGDGSWSISKDLTSTKKVKHTGLFHGIAGIIYFLLVYGSKTCSEKSTASAKRGLTWLLNNRKLIHGNHLWQVNPKNLAVDPWLEYGFTGISLLFIRAFELLGAVEYKGAAVAALIAHPEFIASNYLSQANGLAGLGEVYLEAYRVFKEEKWQNRSSHIASFLMHAGRETNEDSLYWLDGSDTRPAPDFFGGHSGITHFLQRFGNPEKMGMHLFSI